MKKTNIKNLGLTELKERFKALGVEGYRARQVKQWVHQKQVSSFEEMTNIKKSFRELLDQHFEIPRLTILSHQVSNDGTEKYLFELPDSKAIESVLIPSERRTTLCVSSQVGCGMGCDFCLTAKMGLVRNLNVYEIVDQVGAIIRDQNGREGTREISNIVFMGMGEPFANTQNLYKAIEILLDTNCYNLSRHHITVSTSGLAPEIEKFGDKTPVKLAVSLNATTDKVRDVLMPINKKFPIERLMEACRRTHLPKRNRITFEYVMVHGVNDTLDDAKRLVRLLSTVKSKVNLIPVNEYPESPYKRPPDEWILKFQKVLLDKGYVANIRQSRGQDILGACGQLATQKKCA